MSGKERSIVLACYLTLIIGFATVVAYKYLVGILDFDSFVAQYTGVIVVLGGLLIKLPPGSAENATVTVPVADVTMTAGESVTSVETMNVEGEDVTVTQKDSP